MLGRTAGIRRLSLLALVACAVAGLSAAPAGAAKKRPAGAVKVASAKVKKVSRTTCVQIGRSWLPATAVGKGWYLAHDRQAAAFARQARRAKGKRRKQLQAKARAWQRKAKAGRAACNPRTGDRPQDGAGGRRPATRPSSGTTARPATGGGAPAPTGPTSPTGPTGPGTPAGGALRFSVAGATGLALRGANGRRSARADGAASNLAAVSPGGQTKDAVSSGTATVQNFLIAPNDKIYLAFAPPGVNLDDTAAPGDRCILAELDAASGVPTCIDKTLGSISPTKPAVQFDASGAIWYSGRTNDQKTVLRRHLDGTTTDMIPPDNVHLSQFLVLPGGGAIITGRTSATNAEWTRRVTPQGGLVTLAGEATYWMRQFPDGNVYLGLYGRVRRFLTATSALDPQFWMACTTCGMNPPQNTVHRSEEACVNPGGPYYAAFCNSGFGTYVKDIIRTTDGKMFSIPIDNPSGAGELVQLYPDLRFAALGATPAANEFPAPAVKDIRVAQGVITNIVLSGLNADGVNVTTIYNTSNGTETELMGPANEIEVYHVDYQSSSNRVLFDGLRFVDNKYVLGHVDLNTMTVTASSTANVKWADFQAFG